MLFVFLRVIRISIVTVKYRRENFSSLFGIVIPKFLIVSATLFSTFWGLSELAEFSNSTKKDKIIGGLRTVGIASLVIVPIFYKYFNEQELIILIVVLTFS
jgi:hypothetical protein